MDRFEQVQAFHDKNNIAVGLDFHTELETLSVQEREALLKASEALANFATLFEELFAAERNRIMLRMHLMCEELGEIATALKDSNREMLLDGLTDLEYVTVGTAVTFDLPIVSAFDEVHRSNMTKSAVRDESARFRGKGPDYSPPNLDRILKLWDKQGGCRTTRR